MTITDAAIQQLVDRAAIREVLLRYAHGVDRRDLDLVASCFTPDAAYKGALGEGSIETALAALRERMQRYESTMHFIANQLIDLAADTAASETYAIAYHRMDGGRQNMAVGVRYVDDLVRRDGRWLIQRRIVHLEWQRYDEIIP